MLLQTGWADRSLRVGLERGDIHRLHRGWYIDGSLWNDLYPEQRHLAHVFAVVAAGRGAVGPMMGASAAVLQMLPLWFLLPDRVHTLLVDRRASSSRDVLRHDIPTSPVDIVDVDGISCTSLARTVFDVARMESPTVGIACADAAFRRLAASGRDYDEVVAEEFRAELRSLIGKAPGARGLRRAIEIVELADGRAESAGESAERILLSRLGYDDLRLQVPVQGPDGRLVFPDVEVPAANAFVEFDGNAKYLDPALRGGRSADEVVLDEKRRDNWIRARTGRIMVRVTAADLRSERALADRLALYGIQVPRSPWRV